MTTVCCVFVKGHVKDFRPEYVIKLASMVKRHMDRPYKFVCLTDEPDRLYVRDMDVIGIPKPALLPGKMPLGYSAGKFLYGWWSKLSIFDPAVGLKGRCLYLDLDSLVVDSLAPILDFPAPFALIPHAGTFNGRYGLKVVKRFNSSVMVWNAGEQDHLFTKWSPEVAMRLHGDQDFVGENCPDAATFPSEWTPRISALDENVAPKPPAKVVLCKWPKNSIAADMYPWVREVWV